MNLLNTQLSPVGVCVTFNKTTVALRGQIEKGPQSSQNTTEVFLLDTCIYSITRIM